MGSKKPEKINYKGNLKEYWDLLSKYKWVFAISLVLVMLAEGVSVASRLLFKDFVDKADLFSSGALSGSEFTSQAYIIVLAVLAVAIATFFIKWMMVHVTNLIETRISLDLKRRYFSHIIGLDYEFHTTNKTGVVISRFARASGAVVNFTDLIIYSFCPLIFQLAILIPLLSGIGLVYSMILLSVSATFLTYSYYISTHFTKDRDAENEALDVERGKIADVFTNIAPVKYFAKNKAVEGDFLSLAKNTQKAEIKAWGWWRWIMSGQEIIIASGTALLLYVSISQFVRGEINLGTLTFIYTAYLGLLGPLHGFSHGIRASATAMADMQDLFEYKSVSKKVKDAKDSKPIEITRGDVEFREVSFGFENEALFHKFRLKVPGGKTIALVGHSGSGKTTLIKLLYRLYDVKSGAVLVDGKDIRSVTQESLRSEMSIVPQDVILFDDTIYNNIRFSKPEASKEEVMAAIKSAQLDKFISKLSQKEETIVGERGIKLSGGERQRVAIARALLADKKILVLDEATSSLDSGTENEIQKDLEKLMKGRTTLVIAHRLSTIMKADEIVVMKEGKIVQKGSHNELIAQDGEYKRLWDLQKGGYLPD